MQCTKSGMSKSIFKLALGDFALAALKKMQDTKIEKEKEMELFCSPNHPRANYRVDFEGLWSQGLNRQ